jgi:DNA repair protein RadC
MEQKIRMTGPMKVAEIQLAYKSKVKASERLVIGNSKDSYRLFRQYWNMEQIELVEQFKILLLNQANHALGLLEMSTGGGVGTVMDIRLVFAAALKANAARLVLCHNHPSGALKPSMQDQRITEKARQAGTLLEVAILDHLIITRDAYFSFLDEGLL